MLPQELYPDSAQLCHTQGLRSDTLSGSSGNVLSLPTVGYCTAAKFHAMGLPVGSNLKCCKRTQSTVSASDEDRVVSVALAGYKYVGDTH